MTTTPAANPPPDDHAPDDRQRRIRWRLVLGEASEDVLGDGLLDKQNQERDVARGYHYKREYGRGRNVGGGPRTDPRGGDGAPAMTVPGGI
ncbi:MAG: hypothetical protein AB7K09_25225, partial [Planctomycetota bacterium]